MATEKIDKKLMWVDWTHDAGETYERPENIDDMDEQVDDMSEFTTKYADQMLDEYEERFGGGSKEKRRMRRDEEEEDDE